MSMHARRLPNPVFNADVTLRFQDDSTMAKYLISFPSAAMVVPHDELETVGRDAHAVINEAKAAGVYVFGGGIDEKVPPALVSADGTVAAGGDALGPPDKGGLHALARTR